jgi:hypothetical protein
MWLIIFYFLGDRKADLSLPLRRFRPEGVPAEQWKTFKPT